MGPNHQLHRFSCTQSGQIPFRRVAGLVSRSCSLDLLRLALCDFRVRVDGKGAKLALSLAPALMKDSLAGTSQVGCVSGAGGSLSALTIQLFELGFRVLGQLNAVCHACGAAG